VPYVGDHHTPVPGLTGGIDRALIAALRVHGLPMKLVTWIGNYINDSEQPILEPITDYLAADHRYVNVRYDLDDPTFRAVKAITSRNVGRYRGHPRLTANVYRAFHEVSDVAFVRGYGGEILRGFYDLSRHTRSKSDISAPELFRMFNYGLRIGWDIPGRRRIYLA
jgi:hypothetical protein